MKASTSSSNKTSDTIFIRATAVLLALLLWQLSSYFINSFVLASPLQVIFKLTELLRQKNTYFIIIHSGMKISVGFLLGFFLAVILASLSYSNRLLSSLINPYMLAIKSTPIASFIILILFLIPSNNLSIFVAALIVLPINYYSCLSGLRATDDKLLFMAKVYKISKIKKVIYIYLPQLKNYVMASVSSSIGMAWKSGIAAEVIGIPKNSMGRMLYDAKIYLEMDSLFAWTIFIVISSFLMEKLVALILKLLYNYLENL